MKLADRQIALWLQPIDEQESGSPEKILSKRELERYNRTNSEKKRAELYSSRLLLRKILKHYFPQAADQATITTDKMGRPFWQLRGRNIPLYFSLSHTTGLAACAICHNPGIGCDIEAIRPRKNMEELAKKVFGKKEMCQYQTKRQEGRCHFFYQSWTLKEAYLKARGIGLRSPLTELDFSHRISASQFTSVIFSEKNDAKSWSFFHHFLKKEELWYSLAVASTLKKPELCGIFSRRPSRFEFDRILFRS